MRKEVLATIIGQLLIEQVSCAHEPATAADCLETILSEKFPELSAFHKDCLAALLVDTMVAIERIDYEYNPGAVHDDKYTAVYDYDEEATLQRLSDNVTAQMQQADDAFEAGADDDFSTFMIVINDEPHEFILGGPQETALRKFISHICYENGCNVK